MNWAELAATTRFAVLATVRPDGTPHAVPIVHAVVDDRIVTAVDHKPKRSSRLARIQNIEGEPRVAVLFEQRSRRWEDLWWVRADGIATVTGSPAADLAAALVARHEPYATERPAGPWIIVEVERWTGWRFRSGEPPGDPDSRNR